ncbi:hypothetical protein ACFWXK_25470 [Streptomyces sp. NPDC059070]|uniref:hypothetical protein n=1 Tax=Streptomyces sp. NPDC059070 TaxID=3346713 RepID=UPI00368CC801
MASPTAPPASPSAESPPARSPRPVTARQGFVRAWGALVPGALGLGYCLWRSPDVDLARLRFAGTAARAREAYGGHAAAFQDALVADTVWLVGAAVTLCLALALGRHAYSGPRGRQVSYWTLFVTLVGALLGVVANGLLLHGLTAGHSAGDAVFAAATALECVTWPLLGGALVVGAVVWATTVSRAGRALRPPRGHRPDHEHDAHAPALIPPWPVVGPGGRIWPAPNGAEHRTSGGEEAYWRYQRTVPGVRENARLGFCVSGGGIRSACVTLGALQALRPALREARYLVSVSGGGYTVGALQLALNSSLTSQEAFRPGSPEEDHLRRHSKYVADGTGEWLVALGVLLRGLLASLFLLAAATATLGLALSWAYHELPVTDLSHLSGPGLRFCADCSGTPPRPELRAPALLAVAYAFVAAAVAWLLWLCLYAWDRAEGLAHQLARAFHALVVFALVLAVVVVLLPLLAWAAVYLQTRFRVSRPDAATGAGLTVAVAYAAALVGTLWRRRQSLRTGLSKVMDAVRGRSGLTRAVPNGFVQYLTVWCVLVVLGAAFLLLLGWAIATGRHWRAWAQLGVPAVLLFIGAFLDQTWMSLHPFYRRRLATAFAVRRETLPGPGGVQLARPYDFASETTTLSRYGARKADFPQVVFAAAANLSGSDRTPPGRRAVSFTLSGDYVGGPDVGYACTRCVELRSRHHIARDLTVESAIAVSGAAFASAMGAQSRAFQTLFALTNARLGSWLPNPGALAEQWDERLWQAPPPPLIRRLPYLLREVFGRYPMDDRLLLVTDGGHYENLGLVELLRHGVRTAVCIDASGDTPPFATTLAQAIALAHEELGITIKLDDPTSLVPGSGDPLEPPSVLSALNARLSKSAVVTGTITYPEALALDDGGGCEGTLIVARATLTGDMPYQLLSYASANPVFPHDSTSDQWFDHEQFDAYQTLGHVLGERAQELLDRAGTTAPADGSETGGRRGAS